MGKLTYTDLVGVDFGKLDAAVSDWKTARDELKKIADDATSGMQAKSDAARWEGLNATVTQDFVRKTAREIGDLHTEAKSIHGLLEDAHTELSALQSSVKGIVAEAQEKNFVVRDNGDGTVSFSYDFPDGTRGAYSPEDEAALYKQARGYADQVDAKITRARSIDSDVQRGLNRAHGDSVHNAGHAAYDSLDDAQAEEAVALAQKGDDMTDKQFQELNRLLRENAREKDGEFATAFYKGLGGPEKALEFYAQMSVQGTVDDASETRLNMVKELQRNMGYALANATEPDAPKGLDGPKHHLPASWGAEFRRLGTQQIGWEPSMWEKPYGYQVLGGILRYGNYDPEFLNPIAEHVTQLHLEDRGRFLVGAPTNGDDNYGFNPSGKLGSGNDPLHGVLEALGHSPEAAEQFFTESPTKYNEDGTVDKDGELDFSSYLDEFTKEDFPWNIDRNAANLVGHPEAKEALNDGPNALGHALEAATTGRPYDSDATGDAIPHTPERAQLAEKIVAKFGEHPELIRHNENGDLDVGTGPLYALRDSLGDITAEYMGDFQRAVYEGSDTDAFPSFGTPADFDDSSQVQRFLAEVGQDPDGYAAITNAQQAYTSNLVNEVVNGDSQSTASMDGRLRNAVAPGAVLAGIMSEARADAILDYHTASDEAFNKAADEKAGWVNRIVGMGVDNTVGRVPIAGDVTGWVIEDIQASVMESIYQDTTDEAEGEASRDYSAGREQVIRASEDAVARALMNNPDINYDTGQDLKAAVRVQAGNSHGEGATWESAGDGS
ncbi:DUF6571 family protein [Streptomyces sp. JJ36]|uniref:DUF6571 family protein n=1 Tax=Streptomyces sp. JJ36 TaxID=2736645 RepID=UPI001F2C6AFF|nr:DUF6571 family protein [Streptomyces sp. JJ36]MCF6526267.1 hypothetical protein [Streptomyces sp. JJ36]